MSKFLKDLRYVFYEIEWYRFTILVVLPLLGVIAAYFTRLCRETAIFSLIYFILCSLSVTAGYHRLWAHKTYVATSSVRLLMAILGAASGQGTILGWARNHRAHHRYSDTEKDPYGVHYGIMYAHIGWTILKRDTQSVGKVNISDLFEDRIVTWQAKHYSLLFVSMGYLFPVAISGFFFHDWMGGFIYAGVLKVFLVQQVSFFVNSLAHWVGEQPFSSKSSSRDNWMVAFVTMGEGFHNFHHQFPQDYRNGIYWYSYDPTKWLICLLSLLGWAIDLKTFPQNDIRISRLQQSEVKLNNEKDQLDWGTPLEKLPLMSWKEYRSQTRLGYRLILIDSIIYDVNKFVEQHPGGAAVLASSIGSDATQSFNGLAYKHSDTARNLLISMRFARLVESCLSGNQEMGVEIEGCEVESST